MPSEGSLGHNSDDGLCSPETHSRANSIGCCVTGLVCGLAAGGAGGYYITHAVGGSAEALAAVPVISSLVTGALFGGVGGNTSDIWLCEGNKHCEGITWVQRETQRRDQVNPINPPIPQPQTMR